MAEKLPPLRLDSALSNNSNASETQSNLSSARERRRQRIFEQKQHISSNENIESNRQSPENDTVPRKKNRRGRSAPQTDGSRTNIAYEDDEKQQKSNEEKKEKVITDRPPHSRRTGGGKKRTGGGRSSRNQFKIQALSNSSILEGFEEDIIEMDEEMETKQQSENIISGQRRISEGSLRELNSNNLLKSVPTDKFYLELEKKFAIQNKELYERREQERLRQEFDWHLKQKQKEDQKYEISTPKTAFNTHRFLRKIFLFLQGINIGFQFWQLIIIFFNNSLEFDQKRPDTFDYSQNILEVSNLMIFFEKLILPAHALSYFFLTICIIDTIDRVDFTKMSWVYFTKCLSFQNQFWSIIFYSIALIISLSLIFVEQPVYLLSFLREETNLSNSTSFEFKEVINNNVEVWQYLSIVRTLFCVLAWLLFSLFISQDETYNSLKNRDFSIIDEILMDEKGTKAPSEKRKASIQLSHRSNANSASVMMDKN